MIKPTVFISYSHKDEVWKERLTSHLGVLSEQGLLSFWEDRQIGAGEDWYEKIQAAMNTATVAVLLVSADSLTSKFILREEVKRLLQRRDKEGLIIFPVIVKSCPWQKVDWLSRLQVCPRDGKPLAAYRGNRRDEALSNIATDIYERFRNASVTSRSTNTESSDSTKINITRLPVTGSYLFGRTKELERLDEAWANRNTHVLSLVAWGGVGKSALVNHWLALIAQEDYRGASRVYAWSFYSQGTTNLAVSADQFIEGALTFFGDTDPNQGSPWDKGERLGQLVGAQRTLLVIDGLEPLQYPPGPQEGRLKDQALQALLRQLAAYNEGLCIITTRLPTTDLSSFEGHTVIRIELENLLPEAGAQILRAQGVKGTQAELEQATKDFGGHSLALTLLGSYLSDVYGGNVSSIGEISGLEGDVRYGGHAQKVMTSYEKWFGEGPELAVLRMLGLFSRPADKDAIAALRCAPTIPGLTDTLQGLSETNWRQILAKLRRAQLLAASNPNQPDMLDTHPLVREHFGQQLKRTQPDAWREGNNRLYEHLKRTAKAFPDTIEEMTPLYEAMAHGCEAGKHEEALNEVYWKRIRRERHNFSTNQLGAFSADLAALSYFFDTPWKRLVDGLTEEDQCFVLGQAGFKLRALGRLEEAIEPAAVSMGIAYSREKWRNVVQNNCNLSQIYLNMGNLTAAVCYARQGAEIADQCIDIHDRVAIKTALANALHQLGRLTEAEAVFREAEALMSGWGWSGDYQILYLQSRLLEEGGIPEDFSSYHDAMLRKEKELQERSQTEYLVPDSILVFQYSDLLLAQGRYLEAIEKAEKSFRGHKPSYSLLYLGLDNLSLGRASLAQAQHGDLNGLERTAEHLERAVDNLRQAKMMEFLSPGLLARAELHRVKGEFDKARTDIHEATLLATHGSLVLQQADGHLEFARLYLARDQKEKARESWVKAKEIVDRMGYRRRDKDIKDVEEQLHSAIDIVT